MVNSGSRILASGYCRPVVSREASGAVGGTLMRSFVVVFTAEGPKAALLRRSMRRGRPRGFGFQHAMELLVRPILLGMPERDAFGHDAKLHPPDVETREPCQAGTREGF